MEGYDFDVVGEDMQDCKCPMCLMPLRNAVVMPCSHSACKPRGDSGAYLCPSCKTNYDIEKLHENSCLYTSVLCGYASCDVTVCRKDLKEHQDQCSYRTIQCEFCSQQFPHKQLEEHHKRCDYFEMTCPQLCHAGSMQRRDIQTHFEYHCPNTEVKCPLYEMGCMEIVLRKDVENHINNSVLQHTPLLLRFTFDLKSEIKQVKDSSSSQKIEIEELERNRLEECGNLKELNEFKTEFQVEFDKLKASSWLRISKLEKQFQENPGSRVSNLHQKVERNGVHKSVNEGVAAVVKIKDTASKDGFRREDTAEKFIPAVKLREDFRTFSDLTYLIANKRDKRFVEIIDSEPELALVCDLYGTSLLHLACHHNSISCIDVLLKHGCPINYENNGGFQSIHYAAMNGSVNAAKRLSTIDRTVVNTIHCKEGKTPLHYAALCNQEEFAKFLFHQPGIEVNAKDNDNKMADHNTSQAIKQIIRQHRSR